MRLNEGGRDRRFKAHQGGRVAYWGRRRLGDIIRVGFEGVIQAVTAAERNRMNIQPVLRRSMVAAGALLLAGLGCSAPGGAAITPTALPTENAVLTAESVTQTASEQPTEPAVETPGETATEAAITAPGSGSCNPPMPDPSIPDGSSWQVYCSEAYGFSFRYPPGGAAPEGGADEGVVYLPITSGTNLIEKYLNVTTTPNATSCESPNSEGHAPGSIPSETDTFNGVDFLKQTAGEGAAGNNYEWVGYSDLSGTLCLSLTFILHSSDPGAFATPPPLFDKGAESAVFAQIMATFTWPTP